MPDTVSLFWFRRDLRLEDNAGLYRALKGGHHVVPVFIFDTDILDGLTDKRDKRVIFIHRALHRIREQLKAYGSTLHVLYGTPLKCFKELLGVYDVKKVFTNHDYEPYAIKRDAEIEHFLLGKNITFYSFKDQVIFERGEIIKDNGEPYTVFTPYSRKWKEKFKAFYTKPYPVQKYASNFCKQPQGEIPTLASIGFDEIDFQVPAAALNVAIAGSYDQTRDFPAQQGTTRLSVHLRFGTISIRALVNEVMELNETLLNELIWREFYMMILWHFPQVVSQSFKKEYDHIQWRNDDRDYRRWCTGETGYPIVDAGMRELNETGFMHNRVRMVVASFLTKHLLVDWRLGEAYFAEKLLDYDLAANNGGWQWAAGCGCDAAPYFRIFNPYLQTEKFDPKLEYVRNWVPEFDQLSYPRPIVDHKTARERCLNAYKKALVEKR